MKLTNINKKTIITVTIAALFVLTTIVAAGILSYTFSDKIIEYNYQSSEKDTAVLNNNNKALVSKTEDIPDSKLYRVMLDDQNLCIFNSTNELIYIEQMANTDAFTEKDINKLKQDGIIYTTRSELIEMLNYLKS